MKPDVYLIEIPDNSIEKRGSSLIKLLEEIDPFKDYKEDEFIPIKITIGDSQCTYNIRPELVKIIVSRIKEKHAKPFLFDTNVIYKGERQNAVQHLTLAQNKGFSHSKIGCPFIIADGLLGQDGKICEINSDYIKKIKIPSFIGYIDNLLALSHATGHILSGYAGAIKNVSMGMVSKPTKQAQHSSIKPSIIEKKCASCGCCIQICPVSAISFRPIKAAIDQSKCIGCGECLCACKFDAIFINWSEGHSIFAKRMVDTSQFILSKFKNKFFITFAFDITKECDCISTKDEKVFTKDIGILASSDPLALDKATVDLINGAHPGTGFLGRNTERPLPMAAVLWPRMYKNDDLFEKENLHNTYKTIFEYGYKKGLGNLEYKLVRIN